MSATIRNKWYAIPQNEAKIPINEIVRIWVRMLNGNEIELHARYLGDEYGWDLPTGIKINIQTIEAFQRIEKPDWKYPAPDPPRDSIGIELRPQPQKNSDQGLAKTDNQYRINPSLPDKPKEIPMEHNLKNREPTAELQVFITYPEVRVECTLSNKYKILMYRERGEVPSTGEEITIIGETDIKKMRPEAREALLWIWAENDNNIIKIGEQNRKLGLDEIEDIIIAIGQKIKADKENEIKRAYQKLISIPDEPQGESVYGCVNEVLRLGGLIRRYGDNTIQEVWRVKLAKVEAQYIALRQEWIKAHGSEELKYMQQTQRPETEYLYAQERLNMELPGFRLVRAEDTEKIVPKERPTSDEIRLAMSFPQAVIINMTESRNNQQEYIINTYLLINNYLGQYQIMIKTEDAKRYIQNQGREEPGEAARAPRKVQEEETLLNGKGNTPPETPELANPVKEEPVVQVKPSPAPVTPKTERRTGFLNNLTKGNPGGKAPTKTLLDD